jgi:hypothetical protein
MLDGLGFLLSRPRRHEGKTVPMHRAWRTRRADADLLRRVAIRLRDDPGCARHVGVACPEDGLALAALLDLLATELPHVDPAVRRTVVESCGRLVG